MKQYKEKLKRNGISVSQELRYKLHLDINIRKFFAKKGVVIGKFSLIFDLNSIELYMPVYFTNKAIVKFKKARILKKTSHNPFYQSYGMIKYLLKDFSSEFNTQSIVINFNNLNLLFNTNSFVSDYLKKLVFFKKILFTRRLFLFLDFIKLTWLFSINAISTDAYVYIFGEIFKRLPKIKHAQFMRFVKTSISYLFDKRTNFGERIKGVKFILSGKYKGKLRAKSVRYVAGFIPLKTIACGITESATVAYTIYGTFGIKMWIYTESSKKGKKKLENFCKRKHSLKLFIKIIRRRKYWQLRKTLLRKYALNLGYNRKNFSRASKQFSKYNKSKYLKKDSKFNNQFLKNKQISKFNYNDDKKTTQLWKNHLKKKYQPLSKKKEFFKNNLDVVS